MSPEPYYSDGRVRLYLGRFEDVMPALDEDLDLAIVDPPTGETSLEWDRWPKGWPARLATVASSMWCFASTRTLLEKRDQFRRIGPREGWRFSHDVVWEKSNGTGPATDRFKRVHESVSFWYRGPWGSIHHEVPRLEHRGPDKSVIRRAQPAHLGQIGTASYVDDGTRLARSVQRFPSVRDGINETEKPVPLLELMVRYGCPRGGLVLVPFSGSGAVEEAARNTGRRAIGIEMREDQLEQAALRLSQDRLDFGEVS